MHGQRHEHGGMCTSDVIETKKAISLSKVGEGHTVLDIGCSFGDYSIEASRSVGEGHVFGIDIHAGSLDTFRARIKDLSLTNIEVIEADVTEKIPLPDGSIDRILIFNVLHGFVHNGESNVVLEEMERVLKKDGLVSIIESRPGLTGKGPPEEVRLGRERLVPLMSSIGLDLIGSSEISPFHDMFLFGRTGG